MFSVGLLYSSRDFLRLSFESSITPMQFEQFFKTFKYSTADKILEVSFKCGWSKLTQEGNIQLTERGIEISKVEYRDALLLQLEDLIINYNPNWAALLIRGRTEAKNFLPTDAFQCFKECGLFGRLTEDLILFWDRLALAYRNYSQKKMTEIGRKGEKLSFDYERNRTDITPMWQAVESNLAGYDILSVVDRSNEQKLKIEVKATTSKIEYAKIHITKNEWETAVASMNYLFHLWALTENPTLYKVNVEQMLPHIPTDNADGEWESVEIPFKVFV